jgi:catechol 2,3-dioxygenase-like lactoylglutathione lyase family enzyme
VDQRQVQNRGVALTRVIVSVSDLAASLAFYREVVGLPGDGRDGFGMLTAAPGVELMLHERPATPSDTAVAPSFEVGDVDAAVSAWEARGGVVVDRPEDRPWGDRLAVVRDPDGHLVCLSTPVRD